MDDVRALKTLAIPISGKIVEPGMDTVQIK
jgi:hypothetical protein